MDTLLESGDGSAEEPSVKYVDYAALGAGAPEEEPLAHPSTLSHDLELHVLPVDNADRRRTGGITDIRLSTEGGEMTRVGLVGYEARADGHNRVWQLVQDQHGIDEPNRSPTFPHVELTWHGHEFGASLRYVVKTDENSANVTISVEQRQTASDNLDDLNTLGKGLSEALMAEVAGRLQGEFPLRTIDLMITLIAPTGPETVHLEQAQGTRSMAELVVDGSTTIDTSKFEGFWASMDRQVI